MSFENEGYEENYTDSNGSLFSNGPTNISKSESLLYPITLVIPFTVIYVIIFITGLVGNVSTCIVISRSKALHTATNYYLFSLAISDLLLLVSGLPPEMYRIWSPETYVFGEAFCILQGFAAETSANATVLTITAFTVERYLAICHPFLSHTMSKLSRAIKYVIAIWIIALCLAAPQAMQFGVEYEPTDDGNQRSRCTVVSKEFYFQRAFEISTFVFFVGPMTLITVLYILIGLKLQKAKMMSVQRRDTSLNGGVNDATVTRNSRNAAAQKRVIKMLVAVVVAFFICWAPFHAQRLLAVYLSNASKEAQETFIKLYIVLMYASGVLYFVSTTVNPVLYHIMSKKFREAFKSTFSQMCRSNSNRQFERSMYSSLFRNQQSFKMYRANSQTENIPTCARNITYCNSKYNKDKSAKSPDNQSVLKETVLIQERNHNFRPRMSSDTSQVTVLTNLSKSLVVDRKKQRSSLQRSASVSKRASVRIDPLSDKPLNRHKRGILSYKMFKIFTKQNGSNNNNHFLRQGSILSAKSTNTISNSSLQDMDDCEFNTSELAKYMEKVNNELI